MYISNAGINCFIVIRILIDKNSGLQVTLFLNALIYPLPRQVVAFRKSTDLFDDSKLTSTNSLTLRSRDVNVNFNYIAHSKTTSTKVLDKQEISNKINAMSSIKKKIEKITTSEVQMKLKPNMLKARAKT